MNTHRTSSLTATIGGILLALGSLVACGASDPEPVSATISPSSAAHSIYIAECVADNLVQEPDTLTLACADAGESLEDLTWSNWGEAEAHAVGTVVTNTCEPNCAEGTFVSRDVEVTASDIKNGAYSTLVVASTGGSDASLETFELVTPKTRQP